MRVPNLLRRGKVGFNMTPMIDVVFLLIIFFLVSSHLAQQENRMLLPLPTAASGTQAVDDRTPRIVINVLRDGRLLLVGKRLEPAELLERLKFEVNRLGKDLEIRIRSDRTVPYRFVEPIMLAAARAGVWNVTFAVYRPGDV